MKKLFYTVFLLAAITSIAIFSSCSDKELIDEEKAEVVQTTNPGSQSFIIGKWHLTKVNYGFGGIKDCSEQKIVYQFMKNGLVTVVDNSIEDGRGIFLSKGDHQYALNEKSSQITLDTATYPYRLEKDELIIDTGAAWDAEVYIFKHVK